GEMEVKHGVRIPLVNLYIGELGNPAVPEKFQAQVKTEAQAPVAPTEPKPARIPWHELVIALLLIATVIGGAILFLHRAAPRQGKAVTPAPPAATSAPEKSIA